MYDVHSDRSSKSQLCGSIGGDNGDLACNHADNENSSPAALSEQQRDRKLNCLPPEQDTKCMKRPHWVVEQNSRHPVCLRAWSCMLRCTWYTAHSFRAIHSLLGLAHGRSPSVVCLQATFAFSVGEDYGAVGRYDISEGVVYRPRMDQSRKR